jgi:hypothetical protein
VVNKLKLWKSHYTSDQAEKISSYHVNCEHIRELPVVAAAMENDIVAWTNSSGSSKSLT